MHLAEHLERLIQTVAAIKGNFDLPGADKIVHSHGWVEDAEKRGAFRWMQLQPHRNSGGTTAVQWVIDVFARFACGIGPVYL